MISVVIPVYNEAESIEVLYTELTDVLTALNNEYEILFIDDASTDASPSIIIDLAQRDSHVRGLQLKQNAKKAGALILGFSQARGDVIITIDADLQDDPAEIPRFLEKIEQGADVVNGWKQNRLDSWSKCIPSAIVNCLSSTLLGKSIRDMNSGFKAYRKDALASLTIPGSLYRFIPHLLHTRGYSVEEIPVQHRKRQFGQSKFSLWHRLRYVLDLLTVMFITRFRERPMHFFGSIGCIFFIIGVCIGIHLTYLWFMSIPIGSRPLLLLSVLLSVLGMQIMSVGLIGELLVHLYGEQRQIVPPHTSLSS